MTAPAPTPEPADSSAQPQAVLVTGGNRGIGLATARALAAGPTFPHGVTKQALHAEWSMSVEDAIDYEAQVQAVCMQTEDFALAYQAFVAKGKPTFVGR